MVTNTTNLSFEKASKAHGSSERVFEYILRNSHSLRAHLECQTAVMLDAMVLANGLCVCVLPNTFKLHEMTAVCSLSFSEQQNPKEEKSSSKKRSKVLSKAVLSTIQHRDGSTTTLHSPVTGHVLEWNHRLVENPSLLLGTLEGYVAVIQPDDKTSRVISNQNQL